VVGVTGVEPVTLRLSSACSNQLSYTPRLRALRFGAASPLLRMLLRKIFVAFWPTGSGLASRAVARFERRSGAEEIRTPDL
jgi:hypothetical protein